MTDGAAGISERIVELAEGTAIHEPETGLACLRKRREPVSSTSPGDEW